MRKLIYVAPLLIGLTVSGVYAAPEKVAALGAQKLELTNLRTKLNTAQQKLGAGFDFFGDLKLLVTSITNAKATVDAQSGTVEKDVPQAFTNNEQALSEYQIAYNHFVEYCKNPENKSMCDYTVPAVKSALDNLGVKINTLATSSNANFSPKAATTAVNAISNLATQMDTLDKNDMGELTSLEGDINTYTAQLTDVQTARKQLDEVLGNN